MPELIMQNNKTYHDVNGQLASIAEGIKLLQEVEQSQEFKNKIINLMEKKCNELKTAIQNLSMQVNTHE